MVERTAENPLMEETHVARHRRVGGVVSKQKLTAFKRRNKERTPQRSLHFPNHKQQSNKANNTKRLAHATSCKRPHGRRNDRRLVSPRLPSSFCIDCAHPPRPIIAQHHTTAAQRASPIGGCAQQSICANTNATLACHQQQMINKVDVRMHILAQQQRAEIKFVFNCRWLVCAHSVWAARSKPSHAGQMYLRIAP